MTTVTGTARAIDWIDVTGRPRTGSGEARFTKVRVSEVAGGVGGQPYPGGPLELTLAIESDAARTVGSLAVSVESLTGTKLIEADILSLGGSVHLVRGANLVRFRMAALHLNPGVYSVRLWLGHTINSGFDHVPAAFHVEVVRPPSLSIETLPVTAGAVPCLFEVAQE